MRLCGVVPHGRGFESLNFWVNGGVVHVVHGCGFEFLRFFLVNGGLVVHGRPEFESLTFGVNGGVIIIHKINKANQILYICYSQLSV
jgi:hypothetical protein